MQLASAPALPPSLAGMVEVCSAAQSTSRFLVDSRWLRYISTLSLNPTAAR